MTWVDESGVSVRASAKINLHLGVGAVRPDGFHPLATVYQAIGLFSTITAAPADRWSVTCDAAAGVDIHAVPLDDSNLALRAARLLAAKHGVETPVGLHIDKGIPVAGGLAGGSADAAATLVACNELWELGLDRPTLMGYAADLGSDVPFALVGDTATGHGRGELVAPVEDNGSWTWVVVTSTEGLSTPEVYAEFDRLTHAAPDPAVPEALLGALRSGDVRALAAAIANDLMPASLSLRPQLGKLLDAGLDATAYAALVSGSGPTCLFLCEDTDHAARVAHALPAYGHVLVATGPVPGAAVLRGVH